MCAVKGWGQAQAQVEATVLGESHFEFLSGDDAVAVEVTVLESWVGDVEFVVGVLVPEAEAPAGAVVLLEDGDVEVGGGFDKEKAGRPEHFGDVAFGQFTRIGAAAPELGRGVEEGIGVAGGEGAAVLPLAGGINDPILRVVGVNDAFEHRDVDDVEGLGDATVVTAHILAGDGAAFRGGVHRADPEAGDPATIAFEDLFAGDAPMATLDRIGQDNDEFIDGRFHDAGEARKIK